MKDNMNLRFVIILLLAVLAVGLSIIKTNLIVDSFNILSTTLNEHSGMNAKTLLTGGQSGPVVHYTSSMTDNDQEIGQSKVRQLPEFANDQPGGLIVYYHIGKTGGTTIRETFKKMVRQNSSQFEYMWLNRHKNSNGRYVDNEDDDLHCNKIKSHLTEGDSTTTILVEIHGTANPGLDVLGPHIRQWRTWSDEYNKPFFAFTLLREPLSFVSSYFRFLHVDCNWCRKRGIEQMEPTEESFNKAIQLYPNKQCAILLHSGESYDPTGKDCDEIYSYMIENFDWVGRTQSISNETQLILHKLAANEGGLKQKHLNPSKVLKFEDSLNNKTLAAVAKLSKFDQKMYENLSKDYVFTELYPDLINDNL